MLGQFVRKEILDSFLNQRFIALAVFSIVLMPLSAYINYEYFEERRAAFDTQYNEYRGEDLRSWNMRGYRAPVLLSSLARGTEAYMPVYFRFNSGVEATTPGNIEAQDFTTLSTFGSFDLLFLVQVVFSLLAVLLAFDMVAGEKERGTLKAVLANRVPRDTVLLGKLIGGFAVLFLVFLIGFLLLYLVLAAFDPRFLTAPMLARMLFIFGASVLFLAGFFSVGLMVSAFCHSTRTAIVVLLIVWVFLQLVVPKAGEMIAAVAIPARSQEAVRIEKASVVDELEEERGERAGDLFTRITGWSEMRGPDGRSAFELLGSDEPEARQFKNEYQALAAEYEQRMRDRIREIDRAFERDRERRQRLSRGIALLSPAAAVTFLVTDAAGTGDLAYATYREAIRDHYSLLDRELFSRERTSRYQVRLGGGSFSSSFSSSDDDEAPKPSDMPEFTVGEPPLGDVVGANAWALGSLFVYLIVPFLVAYVAFLKYDVR